MSQGATKPKSQPSLPDWLAFLNLRNEEDPFHVKGLALFSHPKKEARIITGTHKEGNLKCIDEHTKTLLKEISSIKRVRWTPKDKMDDVKENEDVVDAKLNSIVLLWKWGLLLLLLVALALFSVISIFDSSVQKLFSFDENAPSPLPSPLSLPLPLPLPSPSPSPSPPLPPPAPKPDRLQVLSSQTAVATPRRPMTPISPIPPPPPTVTTSTSKTTTVPASPIPIPIPIPKRIVHIIKQELAPFPSPKRDASPIHPASTPITGPTVPSTLIQQQKGTRESSIEWTSKLTSWIHAVNELDEALQTAASQDCDHEWRWILHRRCRRKRQEENTYTHPVLQESVLQEMPVVSTSNDACPHLLSRQCRKLKRGWTTFPLTGSSHDQSTTMLKPRKSQRSVTSLIEAAFRTHSQNAQRIREDLNNRQRSQ